MGSISLNPITESQKDMVESLERVDQSVVPLKDPGGANLFINSAIEELDTGKTFVDKLAVAADSVDVGEEIVLTDNASTAGFTRNSDNTSYLPTSTLITDAGYEPAKRHRFKELIDVPLNSSVGETNTSAFSSSAYTAPFDYTVTNLEMQFADEVDNLNIRVIKVISGQDKVIRNLIPPSLYAKEEGFYIVNALPASPDPKRSYVIRDMGTGRVNIPVDNSTLVEDGFVFKFEMETTDPGGIQAEGLTYDPYGQGSQFYPFLVASGHDFDVFPVADQRDVFRDRRNVAGNVTLTSPNDWDTNKTELLIFSTAATFTYDTDPALWEEGGSIEVDAVGGDATLAFTGFTIEGAASYIVEQGRRVKIVLDDILITNWRVLPVKDSWPSKKTAGFVISDGGSYLVDTTLGAVVATITSDVNKFTVGDFKSSWGNIRSMSIVVGTDTVVFGTPDRNQEYKFSRQGSVFYVTDGLGAFVLEANI